MSLDSAFLGLAQRHETRAGLAVDGLGLVDAGEGLGQFRGKVFIGPFGGVEILGLAEMFREAVAHDLDLLQFALHFKFLALEQDQTAGQLLDDFAAAFVELALLAAELVELALLARDLVLLAFEVEELFLVALDLDVDFVGRGSGIDRTTRRKAIPALPGYSSSGRLVGRSLRAIGWKRGVRE